MELQKQKHWSAQYKIYKQDTLFPSPCEGEGLGMRSIWSIKKFPLEYSGNFFILIYLYYLRRAPSTATATATVAPTIGLLPIPIIPIISTCAGTDDEPAN